MSDRLYLSCWVRDFDESNMLKHFANLLEVFPLSRLARRGPLLRVYAIEFAEPPAVEHQFEPEASVEDVISVAGEFVQADCYVELEGAWDLWQYERDWEVQPSPITLSCRGPWFDDVQSTSAARNADSNGADEGTLGPEADTLEEEVRDDDDDVATDHLRIGFGLDAQFLPDPDQDGSLQFQQSNLRSLVTLIRQMEQVIPLERRKLWSESGENFAESLAEAIEEFGLD